MPDLGKIRNEIDIIDNQILELFERRMKLTEEVAQFKIETGKQIFDQEREIFKLQKLEDSAGNPFNARGIQEIFRQMMSISRKRQYQLLTENHVEQPVDYVQVDKLPIEGARVIFQGIEGAYTFEAMQVFFGRDIQSSHVETWKEAMELVAEGQADYAVLPIENSTAGVVFDIYDLMAEYPNYIVGEQIIRIEHQLLGVPSAEISDIHTVYSHPQGLAQCKRYLEQYPDWEQKKVLNTAIAAKKVAEDGDRSQAAIASRTAAQYFGLKVLDNQGLSTDTNSTRFIVISNQKRFVKKAGKISIYFELPHESGSLYNMLSHVIYNNLNMTKIESRPIEGRNWEYRFFIDFEGNLSDAAVKNALRGIDAEASYLRILGNY
ncbi:prephenate dehydratase [Novisyntrophococcus fermenticellae]|uniref:prephenate dehydratase n=1 Tax=Novisyntrophococcus fermenticellae TaxID=2068655 RepID=UPI001E54652E|nr:prephenate dehydratase [Novisyntrophococcus fermenticellae]